MVQRVKKTGVKSVLIMLFNVECPEFRAATMAKLQWPNYWDFQVHTVNFVWIKLVNFQGDSPRMTTTDSKSLSITSFRSRARGFSSSVETWSYTMILELQITHPTAGSFHGMTIWRCLFATAIKLYVKSEDLKMGSKIQHTLIYLNINFEHLIKRINLMDSWSNV